MELQHTAAGQMSMWFDGRLSDGTPVDVIATVLHGTGSVTAVRLDSVRRHGDGLGVVATPRVRRAWFRLATRRAQDELAITAATALLAPGRS